MPKTAPSVGRILAMVIFSLSCFGLLLFLWLSFGGPIPLKPEGYRIKVNFPEATTLAEEADVRIAGVNVGKVKSKELNKGLARTTVELEIESKYAPIPRRTRAILRQKTLLGETYVELTPAGGDTGGDLPEGETLDNAQIEPTVELDEILEIFDENTKQAFRNWVRSAAGSIKGGSGQDLNDALGNLGQFATDGADVFQVLDDQEGAVKRLIRDTGVVFGALNERQGALRQLIVNSNNTFDALARKQDRLAETFQIFPTFLDESALTLARLERFSINTHPLVNALKPSADDLGPTITDVSRLAPDLEQLFRDLRPLIRVSRTGLPAAERFLRGAGPVFNELHPFLQELNPILSFGNFQQDILAHFLSDGGAATNYKPVTSADGVPYNLLAQYGAINDKSLAFAQRRPEYDRGNAYVQANTYTRAQTFGIIESFDCDHIGGEKRDASDTPTEPNLPPCFELGPSLWDRNVFPNLIRGRAPTNRPAPGNTSIAGVRGAGPDHTENQPYP